jgi:sporulation protein YlmC with PRC-barrel domain
LVDLFTKKITHIVVEDKELPDNPTRLVPISKVVQTSSKQMRLNCCLDEVINMPFFIVTHYIQETAPNKVSEMGSSYFFPYSFGSMAPEEYAYVVDNTGFDSTESRNIPEGETAVACGMEIEASDGKIGKLDEIVLDPKTGEITHILMREGHLWGKREVAIPLASVSSAKSGVIHLKINKKTVEKLPTVPLTH